jgi:hypothetical protein
MLLARPKGDEQISVPVEIISERELAELAREPVDTTPPPLPKPHSADAKDNTDPRTSTYPPKWASRGVGAAYALSPSSSAAGGPRVAHGSAEPEQLSLLEGTPTLDRRWVPPLVQRPESSFITEMFNVDPAGIPRGIYQPLMSASEKESKVEVRSGPVKSGDIPVTASAEFRNTRRIDGTDFAGFFRGDPHKSQDNQVGYLNLQIGDDAVRLKTRLAVSSYGASYSFFDTLAAKNGPEERRVARFAGIGFGSGSAVHTRLEADVFRTNKLKITTFVEYALVNQWFEDLRFSDKLRSKETREDILSTPGRQTERAGVILNYGPLNLSFAGSQIQGDSTDWSISFAGSQFQGDSTDRYRERRLESKASINVRDLFDTSSAALPTSVWIGYDVGGVRRSGASSTAPARTSKVDAGLYWNWGNSNATVSVWRSLLQQDSVVTSGFWRGQGADIDVSFGSETWTLGGRLSVSQSLSEDPWSRPSDRYLDGGAYLTLHPKDWPRLTFDLDVSRYASNDLGISYSGRSVTAGAALDFAKYVNWPERELGGAKLQKLGLFYSAKIATDAIALGGASKPNHTIGFAIQFGPGDAR